jgi:hypothetical protein
MEMNYFFDINNKSMKKYDDYVIWIFINVQCIFHNRNQNVFWRTLKYNVRIRNIENLKIVTYKDEFLILIMYIKFL